MVSDLPRKFVPESRRIAVVAYTEYPWDPRVRREAESLASEGFTVHVIAAEPRSGRSPDHLGGVHLHELPLPIRRGSKLRYAYQYTIFLLLSSAKLLALQMRQRFDVVHVHSVPDFLVACALPIRLAGSAILLDLHEAMPEILAARFHVHPGSMMFRTAVLLEQVSCRLASHVIVANDGIREAIVSRGVPEAHITAVYNAGDAPSALPDPDELRRRLNLPAGRLIVHAGGINPERDLGTLLRALALLPSEANLHLVVAGDGDAAYVSALHELAVDLGIERRVRFVGRLSHAEALALMSVSEVGVVTLASNLLTELAWPTRIAEFAHLGKPLVVPRLRFLYETLQEGARYYLAGNPASLADVLRELLLQPGAREPSIAKAAAICRGFEWSRMREVLLGVYRGVGGSHAS